MSDNNFSDLGRQLQKIVQDALQTKDFTNLKNTIHTTVDTTVEKVKQGVESFSNSIPSQQEAKSKKQTPPSYHYASAPPTQWKWQAPPRRKINGQVSGPLLKVFGIIFALLFGVTWAGGVVAASSTQSVLLLSGILGPIFVGSCAMAFSGMHITRRIQRFRRYEQLIGKSSFYPVRQLAAATGRSHDYVVKDLKKMIRMGMFPDAYLDTQETCIMMNSDTYREYQLAEQRQKQRRMEEEKMKEDPEFAALKKTVEEGREYIRQIRAANDELPGEEISKKLFRLEESAANVFDYVEKHPGKQSEIRNFVSYYLPTTIKLVKAYQEFEKEELQNAKILEAKADILNILDTIPVAFDNLLSSLYQDTILDITTDISTLETVLMQDGLTGGEEFKKNKKA